MATQRPDLDVILRRAEQALGLIVAGYLLWMVLPEPFRQSVRDGLGLVPREIDRWRRARRERAILESEFWHVGQIVSEYERSHDAEGFARALLGAGPVLPPDPD